MEIGFKRLGLIAGNGNLPVILASEANSKGVTIISIAFTQESAESLRPFSEMVYQYSIGEAGKILKSLKKEGIQDVLMVGKIEKGLLFKNLKFDLTAIKILSRLKNRNDDTIMIGVIHELEREGMRVVDQRLFLKSLFPSKGVLTKNTPDEREKRDIEFGFRVAKEIAALDVGQTVVVKDQAILSVEAIEGTDEAIRRGCSLCRSGAVIVKVAKPNQDPRFDIPTIGITTIETIREGKGSALALEAEKTIVINKDKVVKIAEDYGISITAV